MQGRGLILRAVAGAFIIETEEGEEMPAYARGILRQRRHAPLPGDRVRYAPSGDPDYPLVIESIEERQNVLLRPPLANLDNLLLTMALAEPWPDLLLLDKMALLAAHQGIEPVLVLTKYDLRERELLLTILRDYLPTAWPIYLTGAEAAPDQDFFDFFRGRIIALAGQSGAGKSTFLNRQFARELMASGELSQKIGRGKQTTRHSELFRYQALYLADTPGFQSLQIEQMDLDVDDFARAFPEIAALEADCRFNDCRHLAEPGCAVRAHCTEEPPPDLDVDKLGPGFLRLPASMNPRSVGRGRYERYQRLFQDFQAAERRY